MTNKIKIGILFGGRSREREISFAGGRTVYDNLDKSLFEAVPIFIDSFNNFILLDWSFIYKGSIRDFYPPLKYLPESKNGFQIYAESLAETDIKDLENLISQVGTHIHPTDFSSLFDFAFLCLHGIDGEDGRIQGLLEYYNIPYSGSGILPSSIGMNKAIQKTLMENAGFDVPDFLLLNRSELNDELLHENYIRAKEQVGFPMVIKPANQGSSIGVSILADDSFDAFKQAVERAFFIERISNRQWSQLSFDEKLIFIRKISDIRDGLGLPLLLQNKLIHNPEELLSVLIQLFSENEEEVLMEALLSENEIIVEQFIQGKEFSCIVIEDENGLPVALPPTEIRKSTSFYDYRSKYLPGLSRKITPIETEDEYINQIRLECERLFSVFGFDVYARIDGFLGPDGKVFLNDPNTTSGMLPSSFFFHQAAEIGFNPTVFLTYIIHTSIRARIKDFKRKGSLDKLNITLNELIRSIQRASVEKKKVAVIMGGYSSERHISVESGRNIYEKLASSENYTPIPIFLSGNEFGFKLYQIPINVMLKDNADDIKEKIEHYSRHKIIDHINQSCSALYNYFVCGNQVQQPTEISFNELASMVDSVFIALHGRPGEDGELQKRLEAVNIPYNGSGVASSKTTIDKYKTNEILKKAGLLVPKHTLYYREDWQQRRDESLKELFGHFSFPFIAKPADDGCSSAVKLIKSESEFLSFCKLLFRSETDLPREAAQQLKIKLNEEIPIKDIILVEELISANGADRFLEITGGMLTSYNGKNSIDFEIFEASEALSGGEILSLEEKFLAGEGQNITPARYANNPEISSVISEVVKKEFERAAQALNIEGYARIDAFVRIFNNEKVEVIFIEANSLPGMTPATCIFHQAALNMYKPYEFIERIIEFGINRSKNHAVVLN